MGIFRTNKAEKDYQDYINTGVLENGCSLCKKKVLKEFNFWKIMENNFPYDRIASIHHMIIPIRHCSEEELTNSEKEEFRQIKKTYLHSEYEWLIEGTYKMKSIPSHFHLHLIISNEP